MGRSSGVVWKTVYNGTTQFSPGFNEKMKAFAVCIVLAGLVLATECKKEGHLVKRQGFCSDLEFLCQSGICIQEEWLCDGDNDCGTGDDEVGCPTDCSGSHQFHCGNGRCITIEYRCDGDNDCLDHTDEADCDVWTCPPGEVKCSNGICIESAWLCDGDNDCRNGWDELPENCPAGRR